MGKRIESISASIWNWGRRESRVITFCRITKQLRVRSEIDESVPVGLQTSLEGSPYRAYDREITSFSRGRTSEMNPSRIRSPSGPGRARATVHVEEKLQPAVQLELIRQRNDHGNNGPDEMSLKQRYGAAKGETVFSSKDGFEYHMPPVYHVPLVEKSQPRKTRTSSAWKGRSGCSRTF